MASAKKSIPLMAAIMLAACGQAGQDQPPPAAEVDVEPSTPSVTFTPKGDTMPAGKPSGPIQVAYRLIGKPVVGQPIAVDLRITSSLGDKPVTLNYRINDASAMQLAASQPDAVMLSASLDEGPGAQQVTIIPLREGRLYLNVSASVQTDNGSISTVTAIPIQVGDAPRVMQENGTLSKDAEGESIRVLPAKE